MRDPSKTNTTCLTHATHLFPQVLEAAKRQNFTTGMVVTSRITHASPAAFASHVYDRDLEDRIAEQLVGGTPLGRTVDILLGGGACWFQPNTTTGSCREDGIDVFADAEANGYSVFQDRAGFDALGGGKNATLPFLGLFTPSHMSYEVDRNATKEPSLAGEFSDQKLRIDRQLTITSLSTSQR